MNHLLEVEDYTLGWICALPVELAAAVAVLDDVHLPLPQNALDHNIYKFGRIGSHNIIVACLPAGVYGLTSAANVASDMRRSFPSVTSALIVGIAGGAPVLPQRDIRLGDVVVSEPVPGYGGVLPYDFGKTIQAGRFVQTGVVNKPPKIFLTTLAKLKADCQLRQHNVVYETVTYLLSNSPILQRFSRPLSESDRLFQADYDHIGDGSCSRCTADKVVERAPRQHDQPHIHYGLIASGNQVMKNGVARDSLAKEKNVLCFEMEAAGIADELPSLVVRGICDYSDSHKNKIWQPHAALVAAAFAKELIIRLPVRVAFEKKYTLFATSNPNQIFQHRDRERKRIRVHGKCTENTYFQCSCLCHLTADRGTLAFLTWHSTTSRYFSCDCHYGKFELGFSVYTRIINRKLKFSLEFSHRSLLNIACTLRQVQVQPNTSPGFTVLYKYQRGLIDLQSAEKELRTLFAKGLCSPLDVDPDGRGWLEKVFEWPNIGFVRAVEDSFAIAEVLGLLGVRTKGTPDVSRHFLLGARLLGEGPMHIFLDLTFRSQLFDLDLCTEELWQKWPRSTNTNMLTEVLDDPFHLQMIQSCVQRSPGFLRVTDYQEALLCHDDKAVAKLRRCTQGELQEIWTATNAIGQTLIHLLVDRPGCLIKLLELGAQRDITFVDMRDRSGATALMYAAAYGQHESVNILLDYGANIFLIDSQNKRTALGFAITARCDLLLDVFLDQIAEKSKRNPEYIKSFNKFLTAHLFKFVDAISMDLSLHLSDDVKNSSLIQKFIKAGANINGTLYDSDLSLLQYCRSYQLPHLLKFLIDQGFTNLDNQDRDRGKTFMMSEVRNPSTVDLLINHGASTQVQDHFGNTVIHHAVFEASSHLTWGFAWSERDISRLLNLFELLLILQRHGANLQVQNSSQCYCGTSGQSPITLLVQRFSQDPFSSFLILEWMLLIMRFDSDNLFATLLAFERATKFEVLEVTHIKHDDDYGIRAEDIFIFTDRSNENESTEGHQSEMIKQLDSILMEYEAKIIEISFSEQEIFEIWLESTLEHEKVLRQRRKQKDLERKTNSFKNSGIRMKLAEDLEFLGKDAYKYPAIDRKSDKFIDYDPEGFDNFPERGKRENDQEAYIMWLQKYQELLQRYSYNLDEDQLKHRKEWIQKYMLNREK